MIKIKMMGGLGNQMFQYAALRAMMLKYHAEGEMCLDGLSNMGHAIYSLNHFNVVDNIKLSSQKMNKIENFIFRLYEKLSPKKYSYAFICKLNYLFNLFGFYCIPDGYCKFHFSFRRNIDMIGYFQSEKYFKEYEDIIKKELMVKEPVLKQNQSILKKINETESVCVHIRRGDFVNSIHQICNIDYFEKAIHMMNNEIKDPIYYIFSDDIAWVKENLKIDANLIYVDNQNPNYEDLRLMYSCKNFIMSNSSFSWWAQYLSKNKNKKVIAPYRWYNNNIRCDIYQDNWKII